MTPEIINPIELKAGDYIHYRGVVCFVGQNGFDLEAVSDAAKRAAYEDAARIVEESKIWRDNDRCWTFGKLAAAIRARAEKESKG